MSFVRANNPLPAPPRVPRAAAPFSAPYALYSLPRASAKPSSSRLHRPTSTPSPTRSNLHPRHRRSRLARSSKPTRTFCRSILARWRRKTSVCSKLTSLTRHRRRASAARSSCQITRLVCFVARATASREALCRSADQSKSMSSLGVPSRSRPLQKCAWRLPTSLTSRTLGSPSSASMFPVQVRLFPAAYPFPADPVRSGRDTRD